MFCLNLLVRENVYVLSFDKILCIVVYVCDMGYFMVGLGVVQGIIVLIIVWFIDVNCELVFIKNGKLLIRYILYIFFCICKVMNLC